MNHKQIEAVRKHIEYLTSLPAVDPGRRKLHNVVLWEGDKLAMRAAKYLTLNDEYIKRRGFEKVRNGPWPQRVLTLTTRQSPCLPFESGKNTLPGMESFVGRKGAR